MTRLKRSFTKFYFNVFLYIVIAAVLCIIIVYFFQKDYTTDKKVFLIIACTGIMLFALYMAIGLIKRTPVISFDDTGIQIGKKYFLWTGIKRIFFNLNAYSLGYEQVTTELEYDAKSKKIIYNNDYSNYSLLGKFINDEKQTLIEKDKHSTITKNTATIENKTYSGYRIFSLHLFFTFYFIVMSAILLPIILKEPSSPAFFIGTFILGFLVLLIYLPNLIRIEDGYLIIQKVLIPALKVKFWLNDIYAVKYYYRGKGTRLMMVVSKHFATRSFYLDTIPNKMLKELKSDLGNAGIIVTDHITIEPINMKANMSFNLKKTSEK